MDPPPPAPAFHILAALGGKDDLRPLLSLGYALAKAKRGRLTVLTTDQAGQTSGWLQIPKVYDDVPVQVKVIQSNTPAQGILRYARQQPPDLLLVGWRGRVPKRSYWLGSNLDRVLQRAACPVLVIRADPDWPAVDFNISEKLDVLVPAAGGPNAPLAIDLALDLAGHSQVTAVYITRESSDEARILERKIWLADMVSAWPDQSRLKTKLVTAANVVEGILTEAKQHDLTMLGASREGIFSQVLFGAIPQQISVENKGTTVIVRQADEGMDSLLRQIWWSTTHFLPALTTEERVEVYKQVRRAARPKIDFFVMIGLSAGIAGLGLLLNSPAVIIGAMLVAPLMAAIVGFGLGMIQGDVKLLRLSASATLRGIGLAIFMGLLAGLLVPSSEPTAEILSRTAPSLLDLGVALISGLAGAYAICRKEVSSALPGVAIAAALVPPLATVGIGLSRLDLDIAIGALLLFFTNLVAISAASGLIFFILGFRPTSKRGRSSIFTGSIAGSFILLAAVVWILATLTVASFRQANLSKKIDQALTGEVSQLGPGVELESWKFVQNNAEALKIQVQVGSNHEISFQSVVDLQNRVASDLQLKRPLALVLIVIPTTTLNPINPPTPTLTPTLTLTPTPGPSPTPTSTPTARPTPTPTPETPYTPTSTATATETATPWPSPTATPAPIPAVVANTGGRGLKLRWTPDGLVAGTLAEGTPVKIMYEQEIIGGVEWVKVTDAAGRTGWVAREYLDLLP